ncbi:hypothetical protein E2K98_04985 [Bacillus salipaludis]|uniref:Uncharacterized protein n=1 Tax=Bacillus salipaludis TaxID=2547811 RepID=A0A4R5VXU8_9BACI|nr:hypothetical protein [Bacillus salipaludis]TDK64215.1 hypothetical protein E2K98_04985 [Bacillus salipaludis]
MEQVIYHILLLEPTWDTDIHCHCTITTIHNILCSLWTSLSVFCCAHSGAGSILELEITALT